MGIRRRQRRASRAARSRLVLVTKSLPDSWVWDRHRVVNNLMMKKYSSVAKG